MSIARICDNCGNIFSDRVEGWASYQANQMRKNEDGKRYVEIVQLDACPECAVNFSDNSPMVKLPDSPMLTESAKRIKALEKENKKLDEQLKKQGVDV